MQAIPKRGIVSSLSPFMCERAGVKINGQSTSPESQSHADQLLHTLITIAYVNSRPSVLDQLVRAVHRRMVLLGFLEKIAISLLCAFTLASAAMLILLWYGSPANAWAVGLTLAGFLAGIVWAIVKKATPLQAAMEMDCQRGLDELLSTAWLLRRAHRSENEAWASAIFAQAEDQCSRITLSSLKLRRYGSRLAGGLALALTAVITLAALSPVSNSLKRATSRDAQTIERQTVNSKTDSVPDRFASAENRPILLPDPDDLASSQLGQNQEASKPGPNPQQAHPNAETEAHENASMTQDGNGGGAGQTHVSQDTAIAPKSNGQNDLSSRPPSNYPNSVAASGMGASNGIVSGDATAHGGSHSAGNAPATRLPPWSSADWPAKLDRAHAALTSGTIPPAYRNLVRNYFSQ